MIKGPFNLDYVQILRSGMYVPLLFVDAYKFATRLFPISQSKAANVRL